MPVAGAALSHTHSGFCRFGVFSYHAIFIGYYIASRKGHQGKALMKIMKRTIYKLTYGGRASITEYRDGRARLVFCAGYTRVEKTYKNKAIAKRVMSRWCDGFYWEVGQE